MGQVWRRKGPRGRSGGVGAVVTAGFGWEHSANRQRPLLEATPTFRRAQRSTLTSALWHIMHRKWGVLHDRAWSVLVEESGEWQAQAMSGAPVGRLGMPSPQRRGHSKTVLAMVRAGVVRRASKKAAAARLLTLWRRKREIWAQRWRLPSWPAWFRVWRVPMLQNAYPMHVQGSVVMRITEPCVCIRVGCLDHLPCVRPDGW
jgi:hypothetical protein